MLNRKALSLISVIALISWQSYANAVTGHYSDELNLNPVCHFNTFSEICTGSMIGDNLMLTAKHCVKMLNAATIKYFGPPKIVCEDKVSGIKESRSMADFRMLESNPADHYLPNEEDVSSDLALLSLEPRKDGQSNLVDFSKQVIRLVRSEDEARSLLSSHSCFLRGWGRANMIVDGKESIGQAGLNFGVQHTAQVPSKYMIGAMRTIFSVNDSITKALDDQTPMPTEGLKEALTKSPAEVVMFGLRAYWLDKPVLDRGQPPEADSTIINAIEDGDSGGPLLCTAREGGRDQLVQVGVNVAGSSVDMDDPSVPRESIMALISQPKVQAFLEKAMVELKEKPFIGR